MIPEDRIVKPENENDVIREDLTIAYQKQSDSKGADNARGFRQWGDAGERPRLVFLHEAFIA